MHVVLYGLHSRNSYPSSLQALHLCLLHELNNTGTNSCLSLHTPPEAPDLGTHAAPRAGLVNMLQ